MTHIYHPDLPGYDPQQIIHDGCPECEYRGEDIVRALANLDPPTFARAWKRAGELQADGLPNASATELPLLKVLAAIEVQFERRGCPLGTIPGDGLPIPPHSLDQARAIFAAADKAQEDQA